jgi:hypothetical protein
MGGRLSRALYRWRLSRERRAQRRRSRGLAIGRRITPEDRAADTRAEDLLASVVGEEGLAAYRALGFLHSFGSPEGDGLPGYGYLIYPHRPIVSFDTRTGRLLNELCVRFPDRDGAGEARRLPDADDVLAKWLALRGDELGLLAEANIDRPGTQIDPEQARRDLVRLQEWVALSGSGASGGFKTAT